MANEKINKFSFHSKLEENYRIFQLDGNLISDDDYNTLIDELNKNTCWNLLFDLKRLSYISSLGISFFVKSMTRARINGGEIMLINLNQKVKEVFTITKLDQVFSIAEDTREAKKYFKNY